MKSTLTRIVLLTLVTALFASFVLPLAAVQAQSGLLSNIPVVSTLPGGGTFEGTLSITEFAVQNGELVVSGVLEGIATQGDDVTEISQTFTDIVAGLLSGGGRCQILFLDIGPIFLDLLGLELDLSQITLDLTAVSGAGNLLGNLLCAVAGLLDAGGPLAGITRLLNQINNLL